MKSRDGTATTIFSGTTGVRAFRGRGFRSVSLAERFVDKAFRAKVWIGVLVVGLGFSGIGGSLAQETGAPATSTETGLDSEPKGSEQELVTRSDPGTESGAVEVALQRRIDNVRREFLVERGKSIDRWLTVIALVLTFFGIVVAIVGLWAFNRFRTIETGAKASAKAAEEHAETANRLLRNIMRNKNRSEQLLEEFQQLTAETAEDAPQQASRAAETVREDPDASLIDKAIASAISLQGDGRIQDAVDLWRAVLRIAESGNDNTREVIARHSIGFLLMRSDSNEAITTLDKLLELDPKNWRAYGNRGVAKATLGRYEEAIADYHKLLELKPNNAQAYFNCGGANLRWDRHQEAIADFNKAIEINVNYAKAYRNRGISKNRLRLHKEKSELIVKVRDWAENSVPEPAQVRWPWSRNRVAGMLSGCWPAPEATPHGARAQRSRPRSPRGCWVPHPARDVPPSLVRIRAGCCG